MVLTEASDLPSFPEGVTVTFKCATGYQPVQGSGSRSITCSGNQWTKLELECQSNSPHRHFLITGGLQKFHVSVVLVGVVSFSSFFFSYLVNSEKHEY